MTICPTFDFFTASEAAAGATLAALFPVFGRFDGIRGPAAPILRYASKILRYASKIVRCASKIVRYASKIVRCASKIVRYASKIVRYASKIVRCSSKDRSLRIEGTFARHRRSFAAHHRFLDTHHRFLTRNRLDFGRKCWRFSLPGATEECPREVRLPSVRRQRPESPRGAHAP
jgi:hypothetical protein